MPMAGLDLDGAARDAQAWLDALDQVRAQAEATLHDLRVAAEDKALEVVVQVVEPARQPAAKAVVRRGMRIADEVGAWVVAKSPLDLARRLLPELKAGLGEVQAFLATPPGSGGDGHHANMPASRSPPAPARPAP